MFNNLIKLSNGRTTTKILATLLVITLTFANFALLGTFMLESIAIESSLGEQNTDTNSEHVKFNVYLDSNDTSVREVSKDINSEDLDLYVSVSVTGNGKLEKGSIDFSESNFKSEENDQIFKRDIETISSQDGLTIKLPIVSRKDSSFNLSLLNMISKIKLTGEYIDENGNITNIDSTKEVKVNWTTEGITQEQVKVSQEIITNKIYKIDGTNKRVLQLLVKTNVQNNKVPVKSTKIEIGNPIAELVPEDVKVSTYNTAATNGGSSIEFNNNQGSTWNYNADENKTYIELTNIAEQDGNVSWQKDATDELIVTYIYDEQANIVSVSSDVKVWVVVYGDENTTIEQTNSLALETVEEKGNIIDIQNYISKEIYKGNMYLGEDTEYKTKSEVSVSYVAPANKISIKDGENLNSENLSTYYKSTLINKAEAINVLGNEGTIKICKEDGSTISEIALSQENSEEYFTVNYSEQVSNIIIETSIPLKEGKIEIINTKAIKVVKLEKIEEETTVESKAELNVTNSQNEVIVNSTKTATANLLEPTTSVDVLLDKTSISNQVEEELTITAILNTNNNSNKLFDNPIINVELPQEITEATLLEDASLLYEDELKIKSSGITTNEDGNKVISVVLEEAQTKYDTSANIVMYLKVKANPFMANKDVEIKTTCINGEETANASNKISIVSKNGILSKNSIKVGENKQEAINNTVTTTVTDNTDIKVNSIVINNNGQKITNTTLTGIVPEGTILKEQLTTNLNNASIYYATKENPSEGEWVNTIEDYTTVKAVKIEIGELEQASSFEIMYTLNPTENGLKEKDSFESQVNISCLVEEQSKQENITFKMLNSAKGSASAVTTQAENLIMSITPKTTIETLHEGQIVKYEIKVTNTGSEDLKNVVLSYVIPEGAVYTELTYAQADDIRYSDNAELKNKEWNIESIAPNSTVTKEVTIKINEGTEQIINKANLKNPEGTVLIEIETEPVQVNKGDISVTLSRNMNLVTNLIPGDNFLYLVIVKNNTDTTMNNLVVTSKVPEGTKWVEDSEYNTNWQYNEETKGLTYTIDTLEPQEIKHICFEVEVNKIESDSCEAVIENTAVVTTKDQVKYESNVQISHVITAKWQITMTAEHNEVLNEGDTVKYIIKVTNIGKITSDVTIQDELPQEIQFRKLTYYTDENYKLEDTVTKQKIELVQPINVNETLILEIEGVTFELEDDIQSKQIKNVAKIELGDGEVLQSQEIINTIVNDIDPADTENSDGTDEPDDTEDPDNTEDSDSTDNPDDTTYSISGLAWLDQNKNGIRDNNEEVLKGIEVILLNKNGEVVKNSENKEISTITTITGTYKFNNIQKGEYILAFVYDTNKYTVSKYQVQDATEEQNSDVISKELSINNKTILVGATDVIKVENSDIQNIDIGLVENAKFDLSLEKYIAKVIVTNDQESTTHEFNEANLAKVEIAAKQLAKSSILVQYQIKIINEGDVQGYVNDVVDYLPKELTFNSEMNPDWYSDSQGNLHNVSLEKEPIEPGKSKTVSLVLTKTLNNNSTGTIENSAEIAKATNLQGINEVDSVAGNKKDGEDDISSASLIISIKTGSPMLYIGIVIISLVVLGAGIYLINKKVLKGGV